MSIPTSEPILPEEEGEPPSLRRRLRNGSPSHADKLAGKVRSISSLVIPSFDYYFGFLLAGMITAAAMLLDAPALYLLAVLFVPFLGPVFGIPLSAILGSGSFFLKAVIHLLMGSILVFGIGTLSGWIGANLPSGREFNQVYVHSSLTWPDLLVLVVGAGLTAYLLVRSPRQKPLVANIAVAYGLVLPLAASGFTLTSHLAGQWTNGLEVFLIHLALAVFIAVVIYILLGMRPNTLFGYVLTAVFVFSGAAAALMFIGARQHPQAYSGPAPATLPASIPAMRSTLPATTTPTSGKIAVATTPEWLTPTHTNTPAPSETPTITMTYISTPVLAKIDAPSGGGAFIREEPGGRILTSLLNGSRVTVISEPQRAENGAIWVQIRTETGVVGWILQSLLATATPSPGW